MKVRLLILFLLFLSVRAFSQCTLTVSISSSEAAICSGNTVTLTANTTAGTGPFTYVWSTGETTKSIPVNRAGTYTVSVSDKTPGCSPVSANKAITVSAVPDAPAAQNKIVCPNTPADLLATGPGGNYQWYDADGKFLKSGPSYTTPPVTGPVVYYVQTTIGGCTSFRTAVNVNITGKPTVTPATICSGSHATLIAAGGDSYSWFATATSTTILNSTDQFTTPVLTETTSYYVEAIINGCTSPRTKVTATVGAPPEPPTVINPGAICNGSVVTLHADVPAGIVDWYSTPTGGTSLISSPDYTTVPLTANTTFYVQTTLNDCQSVRVPVNVKVNPIPNAPDPQTVTSCYNASATLTASAAPSGTYKWYATAVGGIPVSTDNVFHTPPLIRNTTYYVMVTTADCSSARTPINVVINAPLPAPTVSPATICYNSSASLTPTSPNGDYEWFDKAVDGTSLFKGTNFITPALTANTTYYVQVTINGCISARSSVNVTVLPVIPAPTASDATICSGSIATLTATGSGGSYEWYDVATGGTPISFAQVFEPPALTSTKTYYVQTTINGCESIRKPVIVTVNGTPPIPTAPAGPTICPGLTAHLTASAAGGGDLSWYDAATGGQLLSSTDSYDTKPLFSTTTFYVQNNIGDCSSPRKPVTVTVNNTGTTFHYQSATISTLGADQTPIQFHPSGGTFSASPAGLVFVNTSTGQIDVSASATGTYTVTLTSPGTCLGTYSTNITITSAPFTGFKYVDNPYCQDGTNPTPVFTVGASPGIFSASPSGLVFVDVNTGVIDLSASAPGTYTVTNTVPASGGAPEVKSTDDVTINKRVTVDAGPDQKLPLGSQVNLSGGISNGLGGKWSGGAGIFSNPSSKNTIYTPAAGETNITLTLTSDDAAGPCGAASDNINISFFTTPPAPTAPGKSICSGSNTTLSAIAPGGVYEWYDQPSGGTPLQTGPTFNVTGLTVTTTYYVQTTVNGLNSTRTAVKVIVNNTPAPPVVLAAGTTVCSGNVTTLTATGPADRYEWFDVPVGGSRISADPELHTSQLTANITYFVEAILGDCRSTRTQVDVVVTPIPNIISSTGDPVCSGTALNYAITADLPNTTFSWDRAAVAGISNTGVTGKTNPVIDETLINTGSTAIDVDYIITPTTNGCPGIPFDYKVTVNPTPAVAGETNTPPICNETSSNYQIAFNTGSSTSFTWSRAAIDGISNAAVSGQGASTIREVLFNTADAPIDVTYVISSKTSTCQGDNFNLKVTVNPAINITSDPFGGTCSGTALDYTIKSNVPSATFTWDRAAVNNNPASSGNSSSITETLINTGTNAFNATYTITPTAFGCTGKPFSYVVKVTPQHAAPSAGNLGAEVCEGHTIELSTAPIPHATYKWTGPNNFSSNEQNPKRPNATLADAGTYYLYLIIDDCTSPAGSTEIKVNAKPVANAGANGPPFCVTVPSIPLNGSITGGTTTGKWSITSGSGKFTSPINSLINEYIPSDADRAAGKVILTLTSQGKDDCENATSDRIIIFKEAQGASAGADKEVCSQETSIPLSGTILIPNGTGSWKSSGNGTFTPSKSALNASYVPDAADISNGSVKLTLVADNAGQCYDATDEMTIKFIPPPTVDAGGTRYVLKGHTITLNPTVSDENVTYNWSPDINISDTKVKNPVVTGDVDQIYVLTVTDTLGCISPASQAFVKVAPVLDVPNTFTPNGDGTNDKWEIAGLVAYENASVDIFNRYGAKLFHSKGYSTPWDGKYNGQLVPPGVYYYIIDTKISGRVITGNVTVIR